MSKLTSVDIDCKSPMKNGNINTKQNHHKYCDKNRQDNINEVPLFLAHAVRSFYRDISHTPGECSDLDGDEYLQKAGGGS